MERLPVHVHASLQGSEAGEELQPSDSGAGAVTPGFLLSQLCSGRLGVPGHRELGRE